MQKPSIPIIGICGHRKSGKTQLIIELLKLFNERGLRVAVIKIEQDQFTIDNDKHDSFHLRAAGAQQILLSSKQRWALLYEREQAQLPNIEAHIADLQTEHLELVIVEGNLGNTFPKLEVHRPIMCKSLLFPQDDKIVAVATDSPLILTDDITLLDLNDAKIMADFILEEIVAPFHNKHK